jgi:hypothetical protein
VAQYAALLRPTALQPRTVHAIQRALEKAGVVFINGDQPGVRLKKA